MKYWLSGYPQKITLDAIKLTACSALLTVILAQHLITISRLRKPTQLDRKGKYPPAP